MRRGNLPTFRRIGRWFIQTLKIPAVQKSCVCAVNCLVPIRYHLDPWHLYLWSFAGFGGALAGAWGVKGGWGGALYGAILGLLVGGALFHFFDVLGGDRLAGLLFFVLATVGGCLGTRLAGVPIPFLRGPLTRKRILLWLLAIALIVAFWLALYYKWQLEFYRGAP